MRHHLGTGQYEKYDLIILTLSYTMHVELGVESYSAFYKNVSQKPYIELQLSEGPLYYPNNNTISFLLYSPGNTDAISPEPCLISYSNKSTSDPLAKILLQPNSFPQSTTVTCLLP